MPWSKGGQGGGRVDNKFVRQSYRSGYEAILVLRM